MKINKIIYLILASCMLVFSACDPIVDEAHLTDSTDVAGVQLVAKQSTPGGNKVTISMVSPGITGYWDYNLGTALTNEVTFVYPIPGKSTFTYVGSLGSQFFTKTIDVQIDQLDTRLDQDWYDLVSEDTSAGKTWVFDQAGAGSLWWFMSPPGSADGAMSVWWNAGDCCGPSDANGKMHFDLDGAANFYHYETAAATPSKGSFVLDPTNKKLIVKGAAKMLGSAAGNANGEYTIVTLTEDKLVLYLTNSETYATGWTFIFRPE
ncbi:hypothetical protein GON26_15115 [Flavobacterium sp. GA093]|uniref:Lipocalin-like domain-containing protein n=1 Tax=Flavobacterium hydrocarbonoxydans TaxID=2683249 RepID=A0A6I4NMR7_9FLAO|nr:hypothetical protein [Flavobacterium hydrocarbonoxydans]MWB95696.1 hypothetical protein [Flavobacterium hydrocarbonoxydans]